MNRDPALQKAIDTVGSIKRLAEIIGVSAPAISQWERVPLHRVVAVEKATGGKVTRDKLRPDVFAAAA